MPLALGPDIQRIPCPTLNHFPAQKKVLVLLGPDHEDITLVVAKSLFYGPLQTKIKGKKEARVMDKTLSSCEVLIKPNDWKAHILDSGLYNLLKEVSSRDQEQKVQSFLSLGLSTYRKSQRRY